jgi:hypothetical protein
MDELVWFLFLLLPCWSLCYTQEGPSSQQKVFVCLKRFMVGNWSSLQKLSSHASCVPHSHHSWEDLSTTCFHQCLILREVGEYNYTTRALQPMRLVIPSKDTIVALRSYTPSFRPYSSTYF